MLLDIATSFDLRGGKIFLFVCLIKSISLRCPSMSISVSLCVLLPGGDSPGSRLHRQWNAPLWLSNNPDVYFTALRPMPFCYIFCSMIPSAKCCPVSTFGLIFKSSVAFQWHYFCIKDVKSGCICFEQCISHGSPQRAQLSVLQQEAAAQLSALMNKLLADSAYALDLGSGT